jgi:hypothetical protein
VNLSDTRHIRAVLPMGLMRDLPGMSTWLPPPPAEPPAEPRPSIKVAIFHWLNQEL